MRVSTPVTAELGVLFAIAFVGIATTLLSRSVALKRIVLPVALVAFHALGFLVIRRSGSYPQLSVPALVSLLLANAVFAWLSIGACALCGKTLARMPLSRARLDCGECPR